MKQFILGSAMFLCALTASSQEKSSPKFQFSARLGTSAWLEDPQLFTLQAGVQGEYRISNAFSVVMPVQYNHLFYIWDEIESSVGYLGAMVGPRVYFAKKYFVGVGAGYAFFLDEFSGENTFMYYPHVGIDLPRSQISLGYTSFTDNGGDPGFIDLSFAFKIGGKKK